MSFHMPSRPKTDSPQFEISPRVEQQATTPPPVRRAGAAQSRPLRIFTLDPSVSARVGGIATVDVPYEDLQPGPIGRLFAFDPTGVPAPPQTAPRALGDKNFLLCRG